MLPPSIEPRASGHIIEQIEMTKADSREAAYAYVSNGSVYFDVEAYDRKYRYGKLSGRVLDEMQANTRTLDGQGDKRGSVRFRAVEKSLERAYHALAVSVERRIPRLAYGVLRDEYALPGRDSSTYTGEAWT